MDGCRRSLAHSLLCAFVASLALRASASDWNEQSVKALIEQGVLLNCDSQSGAEQFQFDLHLRATQADGTIVEQRFVAERSKDRVAVLLLSPRGFPSSLAINDSFWVIGQDRILVFHGGQFDCRAGITSGGPPGIEIKSAGTRWANSSLSLDVSALVQYFMVNGATTGWDAASHRYWIKTPKGAQLSMLLDRHASAKQFPIRAVSFAGSGPGGKGRMEMAISGFYVGTLPPVSLSHFRSGADDPIVAVPYADIKNSHFGELGLSFDQDNLLSRGTSELILGRLKCLPGLRLEPAEVQQLRDALNRIEASKSAEVVPALETLRALGARRVWGRLERDGALPDSRFRLDFDRFQAARTTEIAFGVEATSTLRSRLAAIVTSADYSAATRCQALDLLGQFGLPPLSPLPAQLESAIGSSSPPELQAAFASLRIRHALGESKDVERLHQVVRDNRMPPSVIDCAMQSLAIVEQLDDHSDQFLELYGNEELDKNDRMARVRALAASPKGRAFLLDSLAQEGNGWQHEHSLVALSESMTKLDRDWLRLLRACRGIALDQGKRAGERVIANRVAHRDGPTLASDYPDEFLKSAIESNDTNLLYAALWNLVEAGRSSECYQTLSAGIDSAQPLQRIEYATLAVAVVSLELDRGDKVSPTLWGLADKVFLDDDARIRRYGAVLILTLLDHRIAVPPTYVSKLSEEALVTDDEEQLALFCAALRRLAGMDCLPALPATVKTYDDVLAWHRKHKELVRDHLRSWYAQWQQAQALKSRN